jgi:hypothetical protein
MILLREYIKEEVKATTRKHVSEIVAKGYHPVGFHEVSMFYGTTSNASITPASIEEQDEFHRLLDINEDLAYEYLNKWLENQGLDRLDVYSK